MFIKTHSFLKDARAHLSAHLNAQKDEEWNWWRWQLPRRVMFANEANVHVNGHVRRHSCRGWGQEGPHAIYEPCSRLPGSWCVVWHNAWCENTITTSIYLGVWGCIMRGAGNTITTSIYLGVRGCIMRGAGNTITTGIYLGVWGCIMRGAGNTITTGIYLGVWGCIMRGAGNTITTSFTWVCGVA